ncbi:MAG: hypothetical protein KA076_02955 [Candidatus Marinimicrobia bacterium]|nr:hypothetical protein [Candidatus Neomarinimicrobiota bacterium]MBP9005263.1 hypothetical protein [Candidatus Neomarinimicrobiota bacterium]
MNNNTEIIDLKKEQISSLERLHYKYSLMARAFFVLMDIVTGYQITLSKAKLIEILASIPYRAWEVRHYSRLTRVYRNYEKVTRSQRIVTWSRSAQDNEYWHLLVIHEKMKTDGIRDAWYLFPLVPYVMVAVYRLFAKTLAFCNIRRAYLFNAEFEDHAEHVYAQFVANHPEWETQPVESDLVNEYGKFSSWADVFRRIGLDERDHRNHSFLLCGKPEAVVSYNGMPKDINFPTGR